MKRFMNYVGQLRLYSFLDLVLMLFAASHSPSRIVGGMLLWIGFLLYLENCHHHSYRAPFLSFLWLWFWIGGSFLFPLPAALAFIVLSHFYTQKSQGKGGIYSPIVRGLQAWVMVAASTGIFSFFALLAYALIAGRNTLGDVRDVQKDEAEGLRTWPVVFNVPHSDVPLHLIGVLFTTTIWWHAAALSPLILLVVIGLEVMSYNWTPR